jgi:hypothetical protein
MQLLQMQLYLVGGLAGLSFVVLSVSAALHFHVGLFLYVCIGLVFRMTF